jgi:hypothetical protein
MSIKCPHCLVMIHIEFVEMVLGQDKDSGWALAKGLCPACNRFIVYLEKGKLYVTDGGKKGLIEPCFYRLVHPHASARPPCPDQVTGSVAEDYREACLVLEDSPKASAALSRRCLQNLLREKAGVGPGDLSSEIQQVLESGKLPSQLAAAIDGIRNIGNFAAHPLKSKTTGEILPVEPGEALWNLDVIESLFDFYYVQPDVLAKKRTALDTKLKEAGKPPMK